MRDKAALEMECVRLRRVIEELELRLRKSELHVHALEMECHQKDQAYKKLDMVSNAMRSGMIELQGHIDIQMNTTQTKQSKQEEILSQRMQNMEESLKRLEIGGARKRSGRRSRRKPAAPPSVIDSKREVDDDLKEEVWAPGPSLTPPLSITLLTPALAPADSKEEDVVVEEGMLPPPRRDDSKKGGSDSSILIDVMDEKMNEKSNFPDLIKKNEKEDSSSSAVAAVYVEDDETEMKEKEKEKQKMMDPYQLSAHEREKPEEEEENDHHQKDHQMIDLSEPVEGPPASAPVSSHPK